MVSLKGCPARSALAHLPPHHPFEHTSYLVQGRRRTSFSEEETAVTTAAIAVIVVVKAAREGIIVLAAVEDGGAFDNLVVSHHHQLRGGGRKFPRATVKDVLTEGVLALASANKISLELFHKGRLILNLVHKQRLEQVAALEITRMRGLGGEIQLLGSDERVGRGGNRIRAQRLTWLGL